jgi:putative transcriptional regulator
MIRCHLSRLMGERRVRLVDVARATKISRNMLAKLYYDRAKRVELRDLAKLCQYFECSLSDLLEFVEEGRAATRRRERG